MTGDVFDRVEIAAVVGDPWYVSDTLDSGARKVALPIRLKGAADATVLVMTDEVAEALAHVLTHGGSE